MASEERICEWCDQPFDGRSDARFCSRNHKRAASRARKRRRERVTSLTPLQSSAIEEASQAADERFRAMVASDRARRVPQLLEAEWSAWERRHPGTAHPDRVASRIQQGLRARAEDWDQGTVRFQRPVGPIAELARASRARQRHPVPDDHQRDSDPDLMEPATMLDLGDWRRGRKW